MRALVLILIAFPAIAANEGGDTQAAAIDRISAQSMKGHLSFLSSDLLEGRNSPSRGLDIAAEYIAAQFRRIGLEEAGDDGYFQTAKMATQEQSKTGWQLTLHLDGKELSLKDEEASGLASRAVTLSSAPVFKVVKDEDISADLANAVVLVDSNSRSLLRKLRDQKPAAIVNFTSKKPRFPARLMDVASERPALVYMYVNKDEWSKMFETLPIGRTEAKISLTAPAPVETPGALRNVVGVLRGSDPVLKNTYVFVTAHYDHIGVKPDGDGDRIYNGANDDGSGTVSVIEIASALASMEHHPKRSIVFMTVFGEEKGLIGSQYYGRHPIFPFANTVADLNLEQLGRTDDLAGPQVGSAVVTGLTYSDLGKTLNEAGAKTGVKIREDEKKSDEFFARSDNLSFAEKGVPAHTIGVAFEFPDYHAVGDEWRKIDYANMVKVDRMIATALLMVANSPEPPKWNAELDKTEPYRKAIHP
jgi:hypothetical protein